MKRTIGRRASRAGAVLVVVSLFGCPGTAHADCLGDTAGSVCECETSMSNPTICVKWTGQGDPDPIVDFTVDFGCAGCASAPAVELKTGGDDVTWTLWSFDDADPNDLGNIGDITIDATTASDDFDLDFENPSALAGARDVKSINLHDETNWTGQSNITGGIIVGNLGDLTVIAVGDPAVGGDLDLLVGGNVTGTVVIANLIRMFIGGDVTATACIDITNLIGNGSDGPDTCEFEIGGNVAGDITIDILERGEAPTYPVEVVIAGNLSGDLTVDSSLGVNHLPEVEVLGDVSGAIQFNDMVGTLVLIGGDFKGTYTVLTAMRSACLQVKGGVTSGAVIDVAEMTGLIGPDDAYPSGLVFNTDCNVQGETCGTTAGSFILDDGLSINQSVIVYGSFTSTAEIDLNNKPMAGRIQLAKGGGGDIVNGGDLTQQMTIGQTTYHCATTFQVCEEGQMTCDLILGDSAGETFSGQASFSSVADDGEIHAENVDGSIKFVGDMAGTFAINGTLRGKSNVYITGNLTSTGTLSVGEDVTGDIDITGDHDGRIAVTGSLAGLGRILVGGAAGGSIVIGEENVALTLINLAGGLDSNGTIVINDSQGNFNANGTIHIGPTAIGDPPVSTKFDGCIRVKDNGSGLFGSLGPFARVEVVGCLAHDIDICIDGDDNGKIRLTQTNCSQTYTWGCPGGCP